MTVEVGSARRADEASVERIIDRWQVREKLGTGSFGAVYRVDHVETGRPAALKLFDESVEDGGYLTELELLFDADHPNIVDVLSFGYTSGRKYIVYEYVDGGNLRDFLVRHNRVSTLTALSIVLEAARGVAFAHEHAIVHRDLKPENLLLTEPDWPCTVKICDFGLSARAAPEQRMEASYGSPAYMAPEQLEGDYDHRADFYSLGVMLYEMLFGRRPLTGDASAIAHAHRHVGLPLPESGSPTVRRLLEKTLAPDPSDRFGRAEDVVEAFEHAADKLRDGRTSSRVEPPRSDQLELGRRWTARLSGHLSAREGTRDGALLLAICGRIVAMTADGKLFEMASIPAPVSEILPGGTATDTVGWRREDRLYILSGANRHEWQLDDEVTSGPYEVVLGPTGEHVAVLTGSHLQLCDLDGTPRWQASLETYGMLPGFCFSNDGQHLWISSESPRTQLYCLSREGEPLVRTTAPDHDVSLCGGDGSAVWVVCHTDDRLCRVGEDGFIDVETDLFESPTGIHELTSSWLATSSLGHLEILHDESLRSRALVRYPAPGEVAVVGEEGIYQTSDQDGYTVVEYWALQSVGRV